MPAMMSVSIRSPTIAVDSLWPSTALSALRIINEFGLPMKYGATPVALVISAATAPVAGSRPSWLGPVVSGFVGTVWGAIAGFYRGIVDSLMMRFSDLVLTLPLLAVAAVLARATSGSWWLVALVIASLQWAYVSRVVRGVVLSLREREFIEALRALGATDRRIIFLHLIPNALGPIIVNVTILVAVAILVETALSFLGLGVQPPDTSLGLLVSDASTAVSTRPWLFYFPGAFIILIALTINFIGDGLRDAFDPTQTKVRA